MDRRFRAALPPLFAFLLLLAPVLRAAPAGTNAPPAAAPDPAPPELVYADLLLKFDDYEGQSVRVHGTFHYLQGSEPIFELRMGDRSVNVLLSGMPPEGQRTIREMRQFSETPLAVTGILKRGDAHDNPILLVASKIDVEGGFSTHFLTDGKQGVVTYPEIERYSERFLNSTVTLKGRFDFRDPNRKLFTLWRGVDAVDIDFSRLADEGVQAKLLQEPNFSNQPLTVKGIVRASPGAKGRYMIDAVSVDYPPPPEPGAAPPPAEPNLPKKLDYADLLSDPAPWLGRTVRMRGSFEYRATTPYTLEMRQKDDSIDVIFEKVSAPVQSRIASLAAFSEVGLMITGTPRAYPDAPKRFYIVADQVEFLSQE